MEGALADSYQWRQLQPLQGSVLEGIARLPKQLLGALLPALRPDSAQCGIVHLTRSKDAIQCRLRPDMSCVQSIGLNLARLVGIDIYPCISTWHAGVPL